MVSVKKKRAPNSRAKAFTPGRREAHLLLKQTGRRTFLNAAAGVLIMGCFLNTVALHPS
jgi:hypothetical protein